MTKSKAGQGNRAPRALGLTATSERTNCKSRPWGVRRGLLTSSDWVCPGTPPPATLCRCECLCVRVCKEAGGQCWAASLGFFSMLSFET